LKMSFPDNSENFLSYIFFAVFTEGSSPGITFICVGIPCGISEGTQAILELIKG